MGLAAKWRKMGVLRHSVDIASTSSDLPQSSPLGDASSLRRGPFCFPLRRDTLRERASGTFLAKRGPSVIATGRSSHRSG